MATRLVEEEPLDLSIKRKSESDDTLLPILSKKFNIKSLKHNKLVSTKNLCNWDIMPTGQRSSFTNKPPLSSSFEKSINSASYISSNNSFYDDKQINHHHHHHRNFRGQQAWLDSECSPLRQILRCLICNESFNSLEELTKHLTATKHYDLEHKNISTKRNDISIESKRYTVQMKQHRQQPKDSKIINCQQDKLSNNRRNSCALDGLQEFVKNNPVKSRTNSLELSENVASSSTETNSIEDSSTADDDMEHDCLNSYEQKFEKYRRIAADLVQKSA